MNRVLLMSLFVTLSTLATPLIADSHVGIVVPDETYDTPLLLEEPIEILPPDFGANNGFSDTFTIAMEEHIVAVLKWQLRTSERILVMVMLLTAAGVLFSGYQLWHAMNPKSRKVTLDETDITKAQQKNTTSTFAFGDGKFEITSPIVGILILLISLGALYFFLTFVYSIEVMPLNGL